MFFGALVRMAVFLEKPHTCLSCICADDMFHGADGHVHCGITMNVSLALHGADGMFHGVDGYFLFVKCSKKEPFVPCADAMFHGADGHIFTQTSSQSRWCNGSDSQCQCKAVVKVQ